MEDENKEFSGELELMRQGIYCLRDSVNQQLDEMLDRIDRLLPAEDDKRLIKYKNYTKADWREFLGF